MQQRTMLLVGLLVVVLLIPAGFSAAQGGGVPFPADAGDAYVLFPDVSVDAPANAATLQQRYVLLARAGNILSVTATMSNPGLITRLELYDASGAVLGQGVPDAAAPTSVSVSYEAMAEGWYYVNVSLAAPLSESAFYSLALTGTTRAVYDVLGLAAPPAVPGAHLVIGTAQVNGMLEAAPLPFLFPLAVGDAFAVTAQGASQPRLRITTFDDAGAPAQTLIAEAPQAGSPVSYSYTSDKAQWLRIDIEPGLPGLFALTVTMPRASGMVADLGDASVSAGPAGGSGELCGGVPARFAIGDVIIVSQEGDNLMLLRDYTDAINSSIGLLVQGNVLEVLDLPVCYSQPFYGEDIWFWEVYSYRHDMNGWVADGLSTERWVCPQNNPACNQEAVTCDLPHADVGVGDMLVVSQTGDNLQIAQYPGATDAILGLASWNDKLEVLAEPVCYYSDWHGSGLWFWNVFSETDNMAGWVVDGTTDETWVCPADNPTCDQ